MAEAEPSQHAAALSAASSSEGGGPLRLKVRRMTGADIVLQVLPRTLVSSLKTILEQQTEVAPERQRLIWRGKVLRYVFGIRCCDRTRGEANLSCNHDLITGSRRHSNFSRARHRR